MRGRFSKNISFLRNFAHATRHTWVIYLVFLPHGTNRRGGRVGKAAAKEVKGPGFESGLSKLFSLFFFGACDK